MSNLQNNRFSTKIASVLTLLSMVCLPLSGRAQGYGAPPNPVFYISVSTNGGSQSGSNYVYSISISDTAVGSTIHYSLSLCDGTYTTSNTEAYNAPPIVVQCTSYRDNGTATAYDTTTNGSSGTSYASF